MRLQSTSESSTRNGSLALRRKLARAGAAAGVMMQSPSERNDAVARSLGPDAYDPPVFPVELHPFRYVLDNRYCGRCGGGILHEVHLLHEMAASFEEAA